MNAEIDSVMNNKELTDKQRMFCVYYIRCFNATKSYQKAYESTYDVANSEGYKLLVIPRIKAQIDKLKHNKLNKALLSEEDIFQKMIDIAFADITDFINFGTIEVDEGETTKVHSYMNFKETYEVDGTLINEISRGKDGVKVRLQDKMRALEWLADRMDLIPTLSEEKLDIEKSKVQVMSENEGEIADILRGFVDASN